MLETNFICDVRIKQHLFGSIVDILYLPGCVPG